MRDNRREYHNPTLSYADICQAIERRRVMFNRAGDDYILRVSDLRLLQSRYASRRYEHVTIPIDSEMIAERVS